MEFFVKEITEFVAKYGIYSLADRDKIKDILKKHIEYKTIIIVRDKQGILAVCRWNMTEDIAQILDLIIRENKEKSLIKRILIKGLRMYPQTRYLSFIREKKYPQRGERRYLISDMIGGILEKKDES